MRESSESPDRAASPHQWGRFEVRDELGRGARSRVYRAWDPLWRQEIALKRWSADAREGLDELRRDFRLLARTPCRHLPRVRELVEHDGDTALVMELVEGEDLTDVVGSIDPRELARGLFGAIEVLHASGIVHGDIKPDNVRVRPDGTVVLVDLGLAYSAAHPRASLGGTLGYFSPEQLNRESWGAPSDIYAAGLVLYEVLLSPEPAAVQARIEATRARRFLPVPPLPDPVLTQLLNRTLEPAPERRFTAEACVQLLEARSGRADDGDAQLREVANRWLSAAPRRLLVMADAKTGRTFGDTLLRAATGRGWSVLRFGANRSDLRPLHALEGLVDDLSGRLDDLHDGDRAVLESSFPAFAPGRGNVVALPGPRHRA
ncbi:MAG: serine/threonine-protein kinase, partial [Myxococcota bacterium]